MEKNISIIILNWNGKYLIKRHIESIFNSIKNKNNCEIIIVDNGSTDGSPEFIKNNYPDVKLISLNSNRRFTGGNNAGAKAANGDILIFFNNDVEVTPNFLEPLIRHFDEPDIFAVGCNIMMKGIRKESGLTRGHFKKEFLYVEHSWEEYDKAVPILYASGAAFACSRKKFIELGGFDTIWDPFYWEDTDLCYRAWKRGWKVLFEPKSIVYHTHRATNNPSNFSRLFLNLPKETNKYLFIWKNISEPRYLLQHFALLPFMLLLRIMRLQIIRILAFLMALIKLPRAIYAGIRDERCRKLRDSEILRLSNDILYYKKRHKAKSIKERLKILYICPYLPLRGVSAGSARMFEMIKRLSARHQVDVVSYITKEEFKYFPALKEICNRVDTIERNYPWQKDTLLIVPSMIDEFYSKKMALLIKRRLYEEDYDIVQFEYLHMAQYVPESYNGTLILTEHQLHFLSRKRDFLYLPVSVKKIGALMSSLKQMIYEINICKKFDKIITMTEYEKEILKSYAPYLDVESIPMGTDTNFFSTNNFRKESTDIIYLGFFRHYPNIDAVLYFYKRIYPLIKKELPEVSFNIVGFDPPEEILKLQDGNGIKIIGHVDDIRPYLEDSKVFIMPIRLGMGMRGKLFEAWSMKKAIVSTSIGCEGIEVESGKDILVADRPKEFAYKTIELIKNEEMRKALGNSGRVKVASKYDWDILTGKLENIYKGLQ